MDSLKGEITLVTGATGFLGDALVRRLSEAGARVRVLVRRPNRDHYIRDVPNVEIVDGDIANPDRMKQIAQGCKLVFHVAAALSGSIEQQRLVNVDGTRYVAIAAANANVERFVHVSTISVYGYQNHLDVTEQTLINPGKDAYSITKAAAETVVETIGRETELSYTILRPGMIYGPRSSAWTKTMFTIARRKPTIWIGDGSGSAYPIYVDDVVELAMRASLHSAAAGEIFNCTPDPSPTWREFLGAYSTLAGHHRWCGIPPAALRPIATMARIFSPSHSPFKDLPDLLPFTQRYITYKMDKANHLLGWQPRVTLKEGIQACIPYLQEKGLL